ncbi:hypothetical protein EBX31_07915 [bacterium]|nr:hypothetical protein [bacterium]
MNRPSVSLGFCDLHVGGRDFFTELLSPHFNLVWDDPAEYVIYGHIGHAHRLQNGIKIYWTQELYGPDWRECDYAIVPKLIDDPRAYYLPIYGFDGRAEKLVRSQTPDFLQIRASKPHFCSLLCAYSDRTTEKRSRFFQLLNRRRRVDSTGAALNNTGIRIPKTARYQSKVDWIRNYRFNIAFENRFCPGWTTEKLVDPLHVHTIPIHWGDPRAKEYFNPHSFISAHDFKSLEELAEYVIHVDESPDLYARYVRATPFVQNQPNAAFNLELLVNFFRRIFSSPLKPITQKRWFFPLTKWRLVKRNKLPGQ